MADKIVSVVVRDDVNKSEKSMGLMINLTTKKWEAFGNSKNYFRFAPEPNAKKGKVVWVPGGLGFIPNKTLMVNSALSADVVLKLWGLNDKSDPKEKTGFGERVNPANPRPDALSQAALSNLLTWVF